MSGTRTPPSGRPSALAPRPYRFPEFSRSRLANGAALIVAPVRKLPLATVNVVVAAGAVAEPKGAEGIALLTGELLLEGTRSAAGAVFSEKLERLGADIEVETDWDCTIVRLTTLREHLEAAVKLVGDVLREPAFPARDVERLKQERLADLLKLRTEPRGLADAMFARTLYAPDSRFTRPIGGMEASVQAITRDAVQSFYEQRFRAGNTTVIVAGDVSVDEGRRIAEGAFAGWDGAASPEPATVDAPARTQRALHIVSKPGAPQSELRMGNVALSRNHRDYFAAVVMNAVLGGLFSSRINLNLREAHAYTYGAYSRFDWRRQASPFVVSTAVASEVTVPATKEIIAEIDRIRGTVVDHDELSLATDYLDGIFPIRFETTEAIADALSALTTYRLPDDYHDTYRTRMRETTAAHVQAAAQAHLHPESLQLLVVGDVDKVRGELEPLGFGPATILEADSVV